MLRNASAALVAAVVLSNVSTASAQALALDRFDPAPAGDRFFGVPSPFVAGELTPHVMALLEYAHNPLVLRKTSDDSNIGSLVSSQMFLHINGEFALFNRIGINLDVPFA